MWANVPACWGSVTSPCINYSNWQMATGRLVFWPITNGHTAGLNRASFHPGHFSWRLSHSVTSRDPKQSHRHRWVCRLKSTKTNNPQMSKVEECVCACGCVWVRHAYEQNASISWVCMCVCMLRCGAKENYGLFSGHLVCAWTMLAPWQAEGLLSPSLS